MTARRRGLLDRLEIRPGQHRPHPMRTGAIMLGVVGILLYAGFTRHVPFTSPEGDLVPVHVTNAADVKAGQPVRVKGIDVGKVEDVERGPGGRGAVLSLRIDPGKGVTLHRDARASVWWRTLLGYNNYVELDPGSPSAPPLGPEGIPLSRTTVQTQVDEVLRPLTADARGALRTAIHEFDGGFGDTASVQDVVRRLGPGTAGLGPAITAMRGEHPGDDLPRLVSTASRAFGALARDEAALGGLIDHADTAMGVTAARRSDLARLVTEAPASMRQTRATLTRLERTLDVLDPVAERLQPGARRLAAATASTRAALDQATPLLRRTRPLLARLRPALRDLAPLGRDGTSLLQRFDPTVDRMRDVVVPWLRERDPDTKLRNYEAIGPTGSVLADAGSQFDANGFWIRFQTAPAERAVVTLPCVTMLTNPDAATRVDCTALSQALDAALGLTPPRRTKR